MFVVLEFIAPCIGLSKNIAPRSETRENEQIETGAAKGRNRKICGLLMRMRSTHNLTLHPVDVLVY